MKILKITLVTIAVLLAVVLLAGVIAVPALRKSGLPELNGEKSLSALTAEVKVIRDERGVSHIYASNEHDLYFMTGYITAQERLWQMDMVRHATQGRLSELFKRDMFETDIFLRALGMQEKSRMVLEKEDPEILATLQAYADGVNAWITGCGKKLPPEFRVLGYEPEPWTMVDITNIIGFIGWDLASSNLSNEISNYKLGMKLGAEKAAELIADWNLVDEVVFPDFRLDDKLTDKALKAVSSMEKLEELGIVTLSGSNNWAVSGSRSETGKPILSNDMHLGFNVPGFWLQVHQVIPGKLNVTGVLFPGEPFIIAGHNDRIAWGMTNLGVDDIDLFVETVDSTGNNYLYNGEWLPFRDVEHTLKMTDDSSQTRVLRYTHHGPVISGMQNIDDVVLSMCWSGYDYSDEIKAVYLLNRAGNWDEFRTALSHFKSISQNFAYADVDGNIGLNTGGGVPVRKGTGLLPRRGDTDEYEWKGYVPFELLPSSFNPEEGFISSANQRTVDSSYPFFISGEFSMPYRIMRIREMAGEKQVLGIEDFKRMITDNHSAYAKMLTPVILKGAEALSDPGETERKAIEELRVWNYAMDASLVAPTLFEFIRMEMAYQLLGDELDELYGAALGRQHDFYLYRLMKEGPDGWVDNVNTPEEESLETIIARSISAALDTLTARYGEYGEQWQWGRIHTITLEHPMGGVKILDRVLKLNSDTYGVGGSYHTVEPYAFRDNFKAHHGASERHIFNTADWDESLTVIPTGTSGIPGSPFYLSQTETYINNGFYSEPFSDAAVEAAKKYEMIFRPGK
ncbi:MAG TPA: penicillin acylase family protein [Bacteroidales bacterium]|jgi:penicillin amidase|nr:penicillin acylase family protein [Bacteroidales bacterium]HOC04693.1 penicillin acylase family protein [Bacteroidales bacterium]HOE25481.1 penicillin acylase family protein [Bacteroidales bacterium]HQL45138.1 penicillin acylase family protein [Bacteroidales bacterium]HQO85251.1 penicillin acylase family protein [Bacteroidales bacterium]